MGRGRQKAKHTKVARDLKYFSPDTNYTQLQRELGGMRLEETEGTWNLGIGMIAVVSPDAVEATIASLAADGIHAWRAGEVSTGSTRRPDGDGFVQGAKGVDGGAVRLIGGFAGA